MNPSHSQVRGRLQSAVTEEPHRIISNVYLCCADDVVCIMGSWGNCGDKLKSATTLVSLRNNRCCARWITRG
jgi:hypothetical protein